MTSCRAIVPSEKTCARCGAAFTCLGACCWCSEVPLDAEARAELVRQYDDCLCPACLNQFRKTPEVAHP